MENKTISLANNVAQHGDAVECPSCGHHDTGSFALLVAVLCNIKRISLKSLIGSIIDFFYDIETNYVYTF